MVDLTPFTFGVHIAVHHDDVHVADVELRFYFIVCHVTVQGRWKGTCDVVINLGMIVSVDRREQQNQEDHNPYFIMFGDKGGRFI